jgi:hypothetical protein
MREYEAARGLPQRAAAEPLLSWSKPQPIFSRSDKRLDHFGADVVAVELIQLHQPEVVAAQNSLMAEDRSLSVGVTPALRKSLSTNCAGVIYQDMKSKGTLSGDDAGKPDGLAKEIAKCDAALKPYRKLSICGPALHQLDKPLEVMLGIVWAGRSLGVVLN